ncbi:response regulator transcription factor [Chryseolinea sp. T2]|uniref:response regulator transcription factor n=1 Tax=Chryseolinea sp. T2 TaxID=3129255 RepID=UPI0030783A76
MQKLSFLLVEDETVVREGLRALLERETFVKAVYEASDRHSFEQFLTRNVDIVILDYRLVSTNGLELLALLKKQDKAPKVIILTGLEGSELIMNLLQAGVHGIVYKPDGYKELVKTIQKTVDSGSYFSERILDVIKLNAHRWDTIPPVVLSFGEQELLKAIANGLTTKEIAPALKMTESTAETYRIRLIRKVGVHNTAALMAYAFRNGIL